MKKSKIIIFFILSLICTLPAFSQNYGGIIDTAAGGGNLGGYSTGELRGALGECGPGDKDAKGAINNELASRERTIDVEAEKTKAAESDVCDAVAACQKEKDKVQQIKAEYDKKLKNTPLVSEKIALLKERNQEVKKQNEIVKASYEKVCVAADAMNAAYKKLAQTYEAYGVVGDPVRLADGTYVADYVDFEAQDYLNKFSVLRKNKADNSEESFGKNWSCSLDSRIIRCVGDDVSDLIPLLKQELACIQNCIKVCEKYNENWKSSRPSSKIDSLLSENEYEAAKIRDEIRILEKLQEMRNESIYRNQYVCYGKYKDESKVWGDEHFIKYIDENGNEQVFEYVLNGQWNNISPVSASDCRIYSVSQNGNVINSEFADGYKIVYRDGTVKIYSKFGILEKIIDRNGNEEKYFAKNGRISAIVLKTGERISVERNTNDFITKISGPVSGSAEYKYSGKKLVSAKDVFEVVVGYSYQEDDLISEIKKADGCSTRISYKYNPFFNRKVCVSIADDNGNREQFDYVSKNEVHHKTVMGEKEIYRLNDFGNTIFFTNQKNENTTFEVNDLGLITAENKKGVLRKFEYNSNYELVKLKKENNASESFEYNSYGFVTNHVDEDGVSESYDYDTKGNVLNTRFCGNIQSSVEYYPNGLISKVSEGKRTVFYEYNNFGSVLRRVEKNTDFDWENKTEFWLYDNQNRVIKYVLNDDYVVTYDYKKNSYGTYNVYENWNGRKSVLRSFDSRNREISVEETDLENKTTYSKKCIYDGKDKILKIFFDGNIFASYEYLPDGRLKTYEVWNNFENKKYQTERISLKTEYLYHPYGNVSEIIKSVENESRTFQKNEYLYGNSQLRVKSIQGGKSVSYTYDKNDKLVKIENSDGYEKSFVYSKAGRLMEIKDSEGFVWKYDYKSDGTVNVCKKYGTSEIERYFYDERGLLVKSKKGNLEYDYIYDSSGNLVQLKNPEKFVKYKYDFLERLIYESELNLSEKKLSEIEISYDDKKFTQTIRVDGNIQKLNKFDAWDRVFKEEGASGTVYYTYDFLGNCTGKKNAKGYEIKYEYSPDGNQSFIQYPDGSSVQNKYLPTGELISSENSGRVVYSAFYNDFGSLEKYSDKLGSETEISYGSDFSIKSISKYDTGKLTFDRKNNEINKKVIVSDEKGHSFTSVFDKSGNVVAETNQLGKTARYSYDEYGHLKSATSFSGKTISEDTFKKSFPLEVNYDFDRFSRCVRKSCDYFDFEYSYDVLGRLQKISDKKTGSWVEINYDELSYKGDCEYKAKYRKYSNGNVILYGYNIFGDKTYQILRNSNGKIIKAEFVLYDEKGRIKTVVNEDGSFDSYDYDSDGRLIKSIRKWNDSYKEFYEIEAADCGIFTKNQSFKGSYEVLSENEKSELRKIINELNLGDVVNFEQRQNSWVEKYSYNCNGCILSVENPVAKFVYEYDSMNRVTSKHGVNSITRGKSISWDDDGNLKEINGLLKRKIFTYNSDNKPVKLLEIECSDGREHLSEFTYDDFGRLSFECLNGKENYAYVYEGETNFLLFVTPLMKNFTSAADTIGTINKIDEFVRTSNDYLENTSLRNGENTYSQNSDYKVLAGDYRAFGDNSFEMEIKTDFEDSSSYDSKPYVVLNLGNVPLEVLYVDGNSYDGFESELLFQNVYGKTVLSEKSSLNDENLLKSEIDIWGNVIGSGKNEFIDNCAKRLKTKTAIFDFGQRFYLPEINSFITMDPARDGGNWFCYSVCDPVNYVDEGGLFKNGLTSAEKANYAATVSEFAKYNENSMRENGNWNGLPLEYNCAEVSTYIDSYANKKLGIESTSKMGKEFATQFANNNIKAAADSVCSKFIYSDKDGVNATHTSDKISDLSNPQLVTPGTLLVWGTDETTTSGHTMTVLARKFDDKGNIIGFTYIEGHLKISKLAELDYCTVNGSSKRNDISMWRGSYKGTYELSGANASVTCSK